ncbi:glycoside hydrolase family 25 protein [Paenibacillus massiliensis]|uniref:glycoside hydrolase family 25 protein n=1 Tax=Paenibacillus massiliensis TaxID=225917 RepID=UPI000415444D|nr:glycoside hydrolase family 25 protein [Paenibacillus massiliensis]
MQDKKANAAEGIDVSRYQGTVDWRKVRAAGKSFAFIKATQGSTYRDPNYTTNVKGARAAGVLDGAYHFVDATSTEEAVRQAQNFAKALQDEGGASSFAFPPVMDYENNPANLSKPQINAIAKSFLNELERLTGRKPMIYTGNSFANQFDASLGSYTLWIARYSTTRVPADTPAWKQWDFWQYSDSGRVNGIQGAVDLNVYRGTEQELRQAYGQKEETPMTEEEKKQMQALQQQMAALEHSRDVLKQSVLEQAAHIKQLETRIGELEGRQQLETPAWAKEAMEAAVSYTPAQPIVDSSMKSSFTFYRILVILHRLGLFRK